MSKESRRRQRQTGQVPASGPTSNRPASAGPAAPVDTGRAGPAALRGPAGASGPARGEGIDLPALPDDLPGAPRSSPCSPWSAPACSRPRRSRPTPAPRSGSRTRPRRRAEGASPQPGYVQPDMGHGHVALGTKLTYTYCPPASGQHYNAAGRRPDPRRGSTARTTRSSRRAGSTTSSTAPSWSSTRGADGRRRRPCRPCSTPSPPSPVCGFEPGGQSPGPVVARFDDMAWPFAALVWGRVLPLQTLDQQAILDFYQIFGERTNPEELCPAGRGTSAAPSGSAAPQRRPRRARRGAVGAGVRRPERVRAPSAPAPASPS